MALPTAAVNYQIVTAASRAALVTAVLAEIKDKWTPIGGVAYRPVDGGAAEYMQAMIPQPGGR